VQAKWDAPEAAREDPAGEAGLAGVEGEFVFKGLKGRVGFMHGEVVKVTPHATTGPFRGGGGGGSPVVHLLAWRPGLC
jgi:hypothetical protein